MILPSRSCRVWDKCAARQRSAHQLVGVSLAVLQSACSAFIALNGVRLLIGVGAFAAASWALKLATGCTSRHPHSHDAYRLAGSVLNLVVLWQVWRLRRRPASAWRQQPVSKQKIASEWLQFTLSVLTFSCLLPNSLLTGCYSLAAESSLLLAPPGASCFDFSISSSRRSCNLFA